MAQSNRIPPIKPESEGQRGELQGQLLIAVPGMNDPRFERSVVYVHSHSRNGAMGFVVNRDLAMLFEDLLGKLGIQSGSRGTWPSGRPRQTYARYGGPVEEERGFVLHGEEAGAGDASPITVSTSLDMLHALTRGDGPDRALLVLGYAGWAPGQLENEIAENAWLNAPASRDIVLSQDSDGIYERALLSIGVRPENLSGQAGHA